VRAVLLAPQTLATLAGRTVIQCSTIGPSESRELAGRVEEAGGRYLEAPVLGSTPEAEAGRLLVLAGGSEEDFERSRPVLESLGAPRLIGPVGHGAALKLALNQLIASLSAAFALSLAFVRREGVDVNAFMEVLRASALYAPTFDKKLARMLEGDFAHPNFPLKHLLKDVRLFLDEGRPLGLDGRALAALEEVLEAGVAAGHAEDDYSALYASVAP
jgi:3-hydroxyisobutyrate dehydrogenase-like beta-hydroxyacid dehydrogenase